MTKPDPFKLTYYDGGYNLLQIEYGDRYAERRIVIPPENLNLLTSMYLGVKGVKPAYIREFRLRKYKDGMESITVEDPLMSRFNDTFRDHLPSCAHHYSMRHRSADMAASNEMNKKPLALEFYVSNFGFPSEAAAVPSKRFEGGARYLISDDRFTFNKKMEAKFGTWLLEASVSQNFMINEGDPDPFTDNSMAAWERVKVFIQKASFNELVREWQSQMKKEFKFRASAVATSRSSK